MGEEDVDDFIEIVPFKPNGPIFNDFGNVEVESYAIALQRKLEASNTTTMRLDAGAADVLIQKDFLT